MKSGCGLHLSLLLVAFVVSFSLVYREARRPRELARGDRMDEMRVAVVSGDTAMAVPYGELRGLRESGGGYLIPPGAEKQVGQQIGARLEVSRGANGRQAIHLAWEERESWYEANETQVFPIRYRRPVSPDSLGLLWPVMVPFVYLALLALYGVARFATRRLRRATAP